VIDVGFSFDLINDGHGLRKLPGPALIRVRQQCVFRIRRSLGKHSQRGTCSSYNETLKKGGKRRKLWSDLEQSPANHPRQLHIFDWAAFPILRFQEHWGNLRLGNARCRRFRCGLLHFPGLLVLQSSAPFTGPLCWGVQSRVKDRDREKTWL